MKKLMVLLLSTTLLIGLAACGESEFQKDESNTSANSADVNISEDIESSGKPDIDPDVQIGDYVTFGTYEQDCDFLNGTENIEWLVLDVQDGKVLLLSKYGLDCKKYNEEYKETTWETCTLRNWLNYDFYNTAFSNTEKEIVSETNVIAEDNTEYRTDAGNDTRDKVFLLSISEVEKYFSVYYERGCKPTSFAISHGADPYYGTSYSYSDGNDSWVLRTPGGSQEDIAFIGVGGELTGRGACVDNGFTIRPAMWVTIG